MVRLALVTSVTCTPPRGPPVRFHSTQESAVPKIASPFSASARTPSTFSRIHCTLPAAKYVAGGRPGLAPDHVAAAVAVERRGDAVGAGVLPDDRVVVRPAGVAVPHQRRLALVGDAERGKVAGRQLRRVQRRMQHRRGALPDLDRVVLDPARLRQDLFVFELMAADLGAAWSKIMQRVLVVPWSIAATKSANFLLPSRSALRRRPSWTTCQPRSSTLTACPAAGPTRRAWTGCCRPIASSTSTATTSRRRSAQAQRDPGARVDRRDVRQPPRSSRTIALDEVADVPDPKILELGAGHGGLSRKLLEWHPDRRGSPSPTSSPRRWRRSPPVTSASIRARRCARWTRRPSTPRTASSTWRCSRCRFTTCRRRWRRKVLAEGTRVGHQAGDHRPAAAAVAAAHAAAGDDAAVRAVGPVRARRRDQLAAHLQPVGAACARRARRPAIDVELRGGLISPQVAVATRADRLGTAVGEEVRQTEFSRAHRREYRRKVQLCLDVFETMLTQSSFEFDRPLTGMEIECNLVDADYQPAMSNAEVLASIADPGVPDRIGRLQHRIQRAAAAAARPGRARAGSRGARQPQRRRVEGERRTAPTS